MSNKASYALRHMLLSASKKTVGGVLLTMILSTLGARAVPAADQAKGLDFSTSDRFLCGNVDADILNGDIHFVWDKDGHSLSYRRQNAGGVQYWWVDGKTGRATLVSGPESSDAGSRPEARSALTSPDGKWSLFSRADNLWLRKPADGSERPLTDDGERGAAYGRPPESSGRTVTDERSGSQPPVAALWSPDSNRFVSYRLDEQSVPELALVQSVPEGGALRPKVHRYHYDMAGDRAATATFFVYDVTTNARVPINYHPVSASYRVPLALGHLWWSDDGRKLYLLDAPMDEPVMRLLEVNPDTGATRLMVEERADTTYFPNAYFAAPPNVRVLRTGEVVWFSERTGWGHLYRYDGVSGELENPITQGNWLVRDIQHIDEGVGYVYFSASGREPHENPYYRHLYRVRLDGSGLQPLTPEPGDHDFPAIASPPLAAINGFDNLFPTASRFSPDGIRIIDHFGDARTPGRWVLRRNDGSIIKWLAQEDPAPLPPFVPPQMISAKSADARDDLYGVISMPGNFDPSVRYPVVDDIYGGPQSTTTPATLAAAVLGQAQALADLGFVVVQLEARGGPFRSKAFRDISYGKPQGNEILDDHIAVLRELARSRPWMDLNRVGIFGTSAGGLAAARALIVHPEFFKVGVASAGPYDLRAYLRTWSAWFYGHPSAADFNQAFAGADVSRFSGKLLLAHGEMDDNVHPANMLRLSNALINAGKQFDMLLMPNAGHTIAKTAYFQRATQYYFLEHLQHVDPPTDMRIGCQ